MQLLRLGLFLSVQILGISRVQAIFQSPETLLVQTDKEAKLFCEIKSSTTKSPIFWFRQIKPPNTDNHYEFLVRSEPVPSTQMKGVDSERFFVSYETYRSTLKLLHVKPSDSGIYICATVTGPKLTFGKGTQVKVVDVFPTTPTPTKKTTPKRRVCNTKPSDVIQQNGPLCSVLLLSLLVGFAVVLLIALILIIRLNYLWNLARHRFVKDLQR
ncbi:T-cell surface glycoprotein CD8 beta chain [Dromiciops gliroides]|uniref:T-cell surface glycoprotein CD8 beta chain n=1 Tax=Dromiciops gliroides TaxID=33562 RepID=UPI001CC676E8|nr:T-cell surface glycoprotein CD8 beta chain [Dromiciops gliroides]